MCGRGLQGPWSGLADAEPGSGYWLGPGNTNLVYWEDGWVVPGIAPSQVPTYRTPGTSPPHRTLRCSHGRNSQFQVDQGDPRGRIRTYRTGDGQYPRRGIATAPHCPCSRLPTRLEVSISQYFSVFLSIPWCTGLSGVPDSVVYRTQWCTGLRVISQLYLSYISVSH